MLPRVERKSGRDHRPLGQRRKLFVLFGFQLREPFEDERVSLIGQLGDQRQVITTEAIGIMVFVFIIHIGPAERDAIEFLLGLILPHGGFNAAKAKGLYRKVRGGGDVLIVSRRLSVFWWHNSSFFYEERDCSLTQKAEAPPGTRGRFGGIPFKEDPNASRPQKRRTREGGAARESKNETREKGTVRSRRNA